MSGQTFDSFGEFGHAVMAAGISRVVQREIREIRPRNEGPKAVVVGLVHEITFLAYRQGELLQCTVAGSESDIATAWLKQHGIEAKVVSGNIG